MNQDMKTLGFDLIIEQLKENAVSAAASEILAETAPHQLHGNLNDTNENSTYGTCQQYRAEKKGIQYVLAT